MEKIQSLLTNGENLKKKYGLKVVRPAAGSRSIERPSLSPFSKVFQITKDFRNTSLQRLSRIPGSIRWAVDDNDKFNKLIQNLRDLLADLARLTEDIGFADQQRLIVEYEVETINDERSLEAIAAVSTCDDDGDDTISCAVSRRLSRVKANSVANQSVGFNGSVSMASFRNHTTSNNVLDEGEMEGVMQEIGITRTLFAEWRKIKTRAGIVSWLKVLLVATDSHANLSGMQDDIMPISRNASFSTDVEFDSSPQERAVRLAINSKILLGILRKIAGYRSSSNHNVLTYPFKPLLVYEKELRTYLGNTQAKLRALAKLRGLKRLQERSPTVGIETNDSGLASTGHAKQSSVSEFEKTERVVEEMKCLIDFMDSDMKELFEIRRRIVDKTLQRIAFEHLWLLFQPGTVVISLGPESHCDLRAYQVLHVTGGRPIIDINNDSKSKGPKTIDSRSRDSREGYATISSRECTDLVIDCFYMDFDGAVFGPRSQKFVISEFTGQRDVSSLPVHPLHRIELGSGIMDTLLDRGEKFIACIAGGRYSYLGRTLTEWDPNHRDTCSFCARRNDIEQVSKNNTYLKP